MTLLTLDTRIGKSVETEGRFVVARCWEEGVKSATRWDGISLWSNDGILELDSNDGCTIV